MIQWWKQPLAGDIVWSWFPDEHQSKPALKPRPALILTVYDDEAPQFGVQAAYGTSQRVTSLFRGESAITRADGEVFKAAGLSFDTKFNLARCLQLPFNDHYFSVPPRAPQGQRPQMGTLHAALVQRAAAAWIAVS
jgi:hypothetical protein